MKALLARLKASHAYRSWQRYNDSRGNVLAGGVAYLGFFSIIPALVLGFTVFGFVLRGQPELFARVVSYVSRTLPGILRDSAHPDGILNASQPPTPNVLSITGAVSLVTLLLSGLGWVDALRQGVRAMFDEPKLRANPVVLKVKDVGVLATLGVAVLLSAVLSFVVSAAATWVLGLFDAAGLDGRPRAAAGARHAGRARGRLRAHGDRPAPHERHRAPAGRPRAGRARGRGRVSAS